jgi:hypothetical protein
VTAGRGVGIPRTRVAQAALAFAAGQPHLSTSMTDELTRLSAAVAERYRVERVVGRGGMATVYLARDVRHAREVALKVLRPDLSAMLGVDRFLQEIRVTANLQHPHILPLYDSGVADGLVFYVMPFVRGESLRARLNREERLDLPAALAIAEEVADALSYAHRQGVVHRDVKPENVLLAEGHALVTDFGIAKAVTRSTDEPLTRTGVALGTPGYMSPEQAAGGADLDARSDIYSFACVIYEMLVGAVPSRWISDEEHGQGRFLKAPPSHRARLSALPAPVERALVHAMAIDPAARFGTPNELFQALTAPAPPSRRFSDTEAKAILRQAAELEASEPTGQAAYSLTGVKRIADEVGIPSRHVEAAAGALDQPVGRTPRVLGLPAGVQLTRTVAGSVHEAEFPMLLHLVQQSLGEPGHIEAALPGVFAWVSETGDAARRTGRITRVQVGPYGRQARITISEDRTAMVAITAGLGAVVAALLAIPAAQTGVALVLPAAAIAVTGGVFALRVHSQRRRKILSDLLDRLTQHLAAPGLGELPPGRE